MDKTHAAEQLADMINNVGDAFIYDGAEYKGYFGAISSRKPLSDGGFMEDPETQLLVLKSDFEQITAPNVGAKIIRKESDTQPFQYFRVMRRTEDEYRVAYLYDLEGVDK